MRTHVHPSSASHGQRLAWFAKVLAACALPVGALQAFSAFAAGAQQCTNSEMQRETEWNVMTNFAGIANGVPIADIIFSEGITATNTLLGYTVNAGVFTPGASGAYQTIPLTTFPGLGLRWSWAGYENISNAPIDTTSIPAVGTIVTSTSSFISNAPFTTSPPTKQFKLKWKFELVVTDVRIYAGGTGDFTREASLNGMRVLPSIKDNVAPINNQACSPVFAGFAQALGPGGAIALPELPKPPTPTCQFPIATLNQSVQLNPASAFTIPASGAARPSGASSETRFNISALNCGANTSYSIYFTDTLEAVATKDFLKTTGQLADKVNLRLFSASGSVPVSFGPPPLGSNLPSHPPGVTNSMTAENSSFEHDFYVQYVRAPGVDASAMTAGSLFASTIATVVYP